MIMRCLGVLLAGGILGGSSGVIRLRMFDVVNVAVRSAWLRSKEDLMKLNGGMLRHKRFRRKLTKVPLGFFATFQESRHRGFSVLLGEVLPADWAEHFRLIGEGPGLVAERVWHTVSSYSPVYARQLGKTR